MKMPVNLCYGEASLPNLEAAFLLCPHVAFSLSVPVPDSASSSCKDTSLIGLGPDLNDLFESPLFTEVPLKALGLQYLYFGRKQVSF